MTRHRHLPPTATAGRRMFDNRADFFGYLRGCRSNHDLARWGGTEWKSRQMPLWRDCLFTARLTRTVNRIADRLP